MINEVEKAKAADAHILKASQLVKEKRGYNALIVLLSAGVLMNDRLGQNETYDFTKILDRVGVEYRFIPHGIELRENAKSNYYHNVMYPQKLEPKNDFNTSYYHNDKNLSVGKEEKQGWVRTRNID